MSEEYNGWANYETWACFLHLSNNEGDYKYISEMAEKMSIEELAKFLKEYVTQIKEMVYIGEANSEAKRLIEDLGSLWRVNWLEVAKGFKEE